MVCYRLGLKILSLSECVVSFLWASVLCHPVIEEACFRMRVTLGVILICSPTYTKHVAGRIRSGSGVPWISGFMRKTSSCASAPSMRFSVLLNSCENFLVTLSSISSEIWSSCDLGTFEFCVKLLLGCSSQFFLFKGARFLCFELPFVRKKRFQWLIIDCLFYRRVKLEVYSFSIGNRKK